MYICMYKPHHTAVAQPTVSAVSIPCILIISHISPGPVAVPPNVWFCCRSLLTIVCSNPAGAMKV